jgi:hypothetical protein
MIAELLAGLAVGTPRFGASGCAATRPALPCSRYGSARLGTFLTRGGDVVKVVEA